jgi:UDP-2,4-diacetamido-2,4,6-trideoxy-beta-L-altropyranose hydrolase
MNIAIRVDSSFQIGTGHVMRCLNLAVCLRKSNVNVIFVCRDHLGHICLAIESRDFEVRLLQKKMLSADNKIGTLEHSSWLGVSQLDDASEFESLLLDINIDLIIVDHYGINYLWERKVRALCNKLMVIDDLADRLHVCDLLVDQNWFPPNAVSRYDGLVDDATKLCLGPEFCLLAEDYSALQKTSVDGSKKIFIFFGGNAPPDLYVAVYKALSNILIEQDIFIDMVFQLDCPERDFLWAQQNDRFRVLDGQLSLASLMANCTIAIGSGGVTTWERMVSRLPSAVITVADNQKLISKNLSENGFITLLGHWGEISAQSLKEKLLVFLDDDSKLDKMVRKAARLVDGNGTSRVVSNIISLVN